MPALPSSANGHKNTFDKKSPEPTQFKNKKLKSCIVQVTTASQGLLKGEIILDDMSVELALRIK